MSKSIVLAVAAAANLELAPISPDWILCGTPEVRNKLLDKSHHGTSSIMVWECNSLLLLSNLKRPSRRLPDRRGEFAAPPMKQQRDASATRDHFAAHEK
jgi:hypothetical protein